MDRNVGVNAKLKELEVYRDVDVLMIKINHLQGRDVV